MAKHSYLIMTNPNAFTQDRLHYVFCVLALNIGLTQKDNFEPPRNQGIIYMPLHTTLISLLPIYTQNWHFAHIQETSTMCPLVDF